MAVGAVGATPVVILVAGARMVAAEVTAKPARVQPSLVALEVAGSFGVPTAHSLPPMWPEHSLWAKAQLWAVGGCYWVGVPVTCCVSLGVACACWPVHVSTL